jgi:hypothetical protein
LTGLGNDSSTNGFSFSGMSAHGMTSDLISSNYCCYWSERMRANSLTSSILSSTGAFVVSADSQNVMCVFINAVAITIGTVTVSKSVKFCRKMIPGVIAVG